MTVHELSRSQLDELKLRHLMEQPVSPTYDELRNASTIVSDDVLFQKFAGVDFDTDDFICSDEEATATLHLKMVAEQEEFRKKLLAMPPEEILQHAYEYSVREDIVCALEDNTLYIREADALLALPDPVAQVYRAWKNADTNYMDSLFATIEERAHAELQAAAAA